MTVLEELYYGNICPSTRFIQPGSEFDVTLKKLAAVEEKLLNQLTDEKKELFVQFKELRADLSGITEIELFTTGFKLGAKLMLSTLEGEI